MVFCREFMTHKNFLFILLAVSLCFLSPAWAETSYDKYATIYPEGQQTSKLKNAATHFPVYPFEIIRYPVDKTLLAVEKYHLEDKVQWIYEWLDDAGISPKLGILNPTRMKAGVDLDLARMARLKQANPNLVLNSWIDYAGDDLFKVGGEAGVERIADTGLDWKNLANYEDRHQEHFYGIGPDSSEGEEHVYEREETTLESRFQYAVDFVHKALLGVSYHNVNISGGKDGGLGQFNSTAVFGEGSVPSIHGDSLIQVRTGVERDTRNYKENSTMGGRYRTNFSYYEGLNASEARFFKYQVDASKYFRLGSDRRVVVLHGLGEHNDKIGSKLVPFHQMVRLGGHGTYPWMSHTLRGFDYNRFTDDSALLFNLEYRYTIWEYRDWKTDAILFWDEGQVFGEVSEMQLRDFRESYGMGFRVSLANVLLLSVEVAHGDEGTNLYVKSSAPF
jgi:hypothetical protein